MQKITSTDALVVIDAQNDFVVPAGALYVSGVKGEPDWLDVAEAILGIEGYGFGYRVTTEDKHTKRHVEFDVFPPHCVDGTFGQKYTQHLEEFYLRCDRNLIKGNDSEIIAYSIATSREFPTHINSLRARNIKRVFVTGWAYDYCVGESAIAYASQGFEVYVVRDATRSVGLPEGNVNVMNKKLELYGVKETFMDFIEPS